MSDTQRKSVRVGLTGPMGAGKSVVAEFWAEQGAGVVNGDEMGRLALDVDSSMREMLAERFGEEILDDNGQIIRSRLAAVAFGTAGGRKDLTAITFPTLYRLAAEKLDELSRQHSVIVFDAALIFEWGVERDFDLIVVVNAPYKVLIERVKGRLGIDSRDAEDRLMAQLSSDEKVRRADIVIENEKGFEELRIKANQVWKRILKTWSTT